MQFALKLLDRICWLMFMIACLMVVAIVFIVTYDVISRNLGLPTMVWAVNTVEYAMLHITFLSIPWLVLTHGHVSVEIAMNYMKPRLRQRWEAMLMVLSALICFYLTWRTGAVLADTIQSGSYEVRAYDVPMWTLFVSMPLGFFFGGLQFLAFFPRGGSFYSPSGEVDSHAGL